MARFYKYFLLLTSSILLLASCQEGSEAGQLLGQWRMTNTNNHYVAFSGSVAVMRTTDDNGFLQQEVFGNFQREGDSLFIQCYSINEDIADVVMVEEELGFKPFNNIRVKIETLSGDILVLSKDGQKWNFHKY